MGSFMMESIIDAAYGDERLTKSLLNSSTIDLAIADGTLHGVIVVDVGVDHLVEFMPAYPNPPGH